MEFKSKTPYSQDKKIYLNEKCPSLPFFEIEMEHFLNKTTVIYGAPKSGKSTIIEAILYEMKNYIPNIIVISPTDSATAKYSRRVPMGCIHKNITENLLINIIKRQETRMKIYKIVNDINNLNKLFNKVGNSLKEVNLIKYINKHRLGSIYRIENSKMEYPVQLEEKRKVKESADDYLREAYKMAIRRYNWSDIKLTKFEKLIIHYLDHNPFMILIMDDVSSQIKNKKIKDLLLTSFTTVRHLGLTVLIALHNDSNILPELRNNAFVSIFTDEENANIFFDRKSGGISKEKRDTAKNIADVLFRSDKTRTNFKKLVYTKEKIRTGDEEWSQFHYAYVNNYDEIDFKTGSEYLWKLCQESSIKIEDDDEIFANMTF